MLSDKKVKHTNHRKLHETGTSCFDMFSQANCNRLNLAPLTPCSDHTGWGLAPVTRKMFPFDDVIMYNMIHMDKWAFRWNFSRVISFLAQKWFPLGSLILVYGVTSPGLRQHFRPTRSVWTICKTQLHLILFRPGDIGLANRSASLLIYCIKHTYTGAKVWDFRHPVMNSWFWQICNICYKINKPALTICYAAINMVNGTRLYTIN